MAVAGDVLIRFAADFAELKIGLDQVKGKMNEFGNQMKSVGNQVEGAIGSWVGRFVALLSIERIHAFTEEIKTFADNLSDAAENLKLTAEQLQILQGAGLLSGQAVESVNAALGKFNVFIGNAMRGNKEQIDTLNELGIKILDANGKERQRADILKEVATALKNIEEGAKRSAYEVAVFGRSGQAVSAIIEQWAKGLDQLGEELVQEGLLFDKELIEKMAKVKDEADKLYRQNQVLFTTIWTPVENWGLKILNTLLREISEYLIIIKGNVDILDKIGMFMNIISGGVASAVTGWSALSHEQQRLTDLSSKYVEKQHELKRIENDRFTGPQSLPANRLRKELEEINAQIEDSKKKIDTLTAKPAPTGGPPGPPGAGNPSVKDAGKSFLDELTKLWGEEQAAKAALENILNADKDKFADDIIKDAERQRKITEAIADVARKEGSGPYVKQLTAQIEATHAAKNALEDYTKTFTQAEADQRKYGNGMENYRKRMSDLNKELATGRIRQEAYDAAVQEATESQKAQADQLARTKGGMDGFEAGVSNAARAYEKAHDAFSMGQQAFTGLANAMSEGLDALLGHSQKTFGEIAASFAKMLANMALQAALSQVFKIIFGSLGFGGSTGGGQMYGPPAPATNAVGGEGRAIGGPVRPDSWYMVGEHGPERFVPNVAGQIVPMSKGDGLNVTVNNNAPGVRVSTERSSNGDLLFTIEKVRQALSRDVQRGGNIFSKSLEGAYGVSRGGA